jgi:hypothetical protein
MDCRSTKSNQPSITARPSPDEKERFATLAARAGISESALAMIAIRGVLDPDAKPFGETAPMPAPEPATDRITIRLRPGDGASIARRAAQRGMKPSAYIAALVRAHVAHDPPWPANELTALKQSVVVLAGLGRIMAQAAKSAAGIARHDLQRTRASVAGLEQHMHDLARAALISWESRSG